MHSSLDGQAAGLEIRSGRLEIYCAPSHAQDFDNALVVSYHGEPTWVQVYLTSLDAVEDAIALTKIGLNE